MGAINHRQSVWPSCGTFSPAQRALLNRSMDCGICEGVLAQIDDIDWSFGLLPHFPDARRLPAEDALGLTRESEKAGSAASVKIAVPILPHISNFDDLDPLDAEPDVKVVRVWPGAALPVSICRPPRTER